MSIFKGFSKTINDDEAIRMLMEISCFGIGDENSTDKNNMDKILKKVEAHALKSDNARLFYGWVLLGGIIQHGT